MTKSDIPAGQELAAAAGWNQTPSDWTVPLLLQPDGAWVCEMGGDVAGSTTAICYGRQLAWIGMVLVAPRFRRQGIGRALVQHALAWLRQRRIGEVKLDATDLGAPLYESLGFQDDCVVERWARAAPDSLVSRRRTVDSGDGRAAALDGLGMSDHTAFGCSRSRVLRELAALPGATCFCTDQGYVLTRPGAMAAYLGPCVAENVEAARDLISQGVGSCAGRQIYWDIPCENAEAMAMAASLGFRSSRRLRRMCLPLGPSAPALSPNYEKQFALAGFEYG